MLSETVYAYDNAYGLPTNVTTYPANANETISRQNAFCNTYEYNITAGSRIFGSIAAQTDSLGRVTRNYYDSSNGRLLASVNVSSGDGMSYTYDAIGNLISSMPAKYASTSSYTLIDDGESVSYTYDSRNFLESITTESTTYNFTYDAFGNEVSTAVGSQELATRTYNANNGKISKLQYGTGAYERYVYDELDNLSEIWYYNTNSKDVYMIGVTSAQDFIDAWNSMKGSIDYVYIYAHGEKGILHFYGEELSFNGEKSFSDLNAKKVKKGVYLFSCHGGAGKEGNNVAWMLAKKTQSKVYACTGSVSYSKVFGKYYARKALDFGIIKTFYYQKRYIFWGKSVAKSAAGQW